MSNTVVAYNLFTQGGELKRLDGSRYIGSYYILEDGTIMSGRGPEQQNPPSQVLLPVNFMPINANNELVSVLDPNTNTYQGVYTAITVKNYENDIEIEQTELGAPEFGPPTITLQPDEFFRRNSALSYDPGREIFVDQNRTVTVATGSIVPLSINFTSDDSPSNITFQWIDSYDRVVATTQNYTINTNEVNWAEETFYCVITDSYGSETSDEVTITIIDPFDHPIIFNNILKNPYGNEDTAEWQTVGESAEEIGKFLPKFEVSTDPIGLGGNLGTIHYHKIDFVTGSNVGGSTYKNQWYPRPEAIDYYNGFTITKELEDNYFRAGQFNPVTTGQNDHAGTSKSSFQIVDLTEYEDLLSGKVYGIRGFRAVLFGWLGGRADQGDRCYVEFKFLDENDEEIFIDNNTYKNKIESATVWDRIINDARTEPDGTTHPTTVYQLGYNDLDFEFNYQGIFFDGNDAINLNTVQGVTNIVSQTGIVEQSFVDALGKTLIVGKMSDMIGLSNRVRKIKVSKYYFHEPGKYDLVNKSKEFQDIGEDYTSDAMVAGLNLRLYPILIDSSGSVMDTGIDYLTGLPAIRGFNMDQLPPNPGPNFIDDLEMQLDVIEWLNPNNCLFGQMFTARSNVPEGTPGVPQGYGTGVPIMTENNAPNEVPARPLGVGYTAVPNTPMFDVYKNYLTPMAMTMRIAIIQYKLTYRPQIAPNTTIYDADVKGWLNYGTYGTGGNLWPDFDNDGIFQ